MTANSPRDDRVEDMEEQCGWLVGVSSPGLQQSSREFKNRLMLGLSPTGLGFGPGIGLSDSNVPAA